MTVEVLLLKIPYEGQEIQSIHKTLESARKARENHKANKDISVSLVIEKWDVEE